MRPPSSVRSAMRRPAPGSPSRSPGVPSKLEVGGRGGVQAELLLLARGAEAVGAAAHDVRARPLAVAREDDEHVRVRAVGDPLLRARDAAVAVGARAHRAGVGARARLGQREGPELVALRPAAGRGGRPARACRARRSAASPRPCAPRRVTPSAGVGARQLLEHEARRTGSRRPRRRARRARRRPSARARRGRPKTSFGNGARGPTRRRAARSPRRRSAARGRGSRAARRVSSCRLIADAHRPHGRGAAAPTPPTAAATAADAIFRRRPSVLEAHDVPALLARDAGQRRRRG